MLIRTLAVVFVVACGGSPKHAGGPGGPAPTDPAATPAAASCQDVAAHLATLGSTDAALRGRCETDAWRDDARGCFASAGAAADVDRCRAMLDANQQQAFAAPADAAKPATPDKPMKQEMKKDSAPRTRGPVKKPKGDSDPCDGGQ